MVQGGWDSGLDDNNCLASVSTRPSLTAQTRRKRQSVQQQQQQHCVLEFARGKGGLAALSARPKLCAHSLAPRRQAEDMLQWARTRRHGGVIGNGLGATRKVPPRSAG